ncbi:hypothetical protein SGPA1_10518 [Streptomyces misionensis JCM 4497]
MSAPAGAFEGFARAIGSTIGAGRSPGSPLRDDAARTANLAVGPTSPSREDP